MGLVNGLINQVGREVGRDLYWSSRKALTNKSIRSGNSRRKPDIETDSINARLLQLVSSKKWSSTMRFKAMVEDIQETLDHVFEHVDARAFDWPEIYIELDRKIDELKLNCKEDEAPILEDLDKKNFVNLRITLESNKVWIKRNMEIYNQESKIPSTLSVVLLSFVGLSSYKLKRSPFSIFAEVLALITAWAMIFFGRKFIIEDDSAKLGLQFIGIGFGIYCLALISSLIALSELRKVQRYNTTKAALLKDLYDYMTNFKI